MKILRIFDPLSQILLLGGALAATAIFGGVLFDFLVNEKFLFVRFPESLPVIRQYWDLAQPNYFFKICHYVILATFLPSLVLLWSAEHPKKRNFLLLSAGCMLLAQWWTMYYFVPQNELIRIGHPNQIHTELMGNIYTHDFNGQTSFTEKVKEKFVGEEPKHFWNTWGAARETVRPGRILEDIKIGSHHQPVERDAATLGEEERINAYDRKIYSNGYLNQMPRSDYAQIRGVPFTPLPMSRFTASLIKLLLTGLSALLAMMAMASNFSESIIKKWLKEYMTEDVWTKLGNKQKGLLQKALPGMCGEWDAQFCGPSKSSNYHPRDIYYSSEQPGFGERLARGAKDLGNELGEVAREVANKVPEMSHRVADKVRHALGNDHYDYDTTYVDHDRDFDYNYEKPADKLRNQKLSASYSRNLNNNRDLPVRDIDREITVTKVPSTEYETLPKRRNSKTQKVRQTEIIATTPRDKNLTKIEVKQEAIAPNHQQALEIIKKQSREIANDHTNNLPGVEVNRID